LRQQNARDFREDEGIAKSWTWKFTNLAIGSFLATVAKTIATPLRTIHVYQLLHTCQRFTSSHMETNLSNNHSVATPSSLSLTAYHIYQVEGPRGFWHGNVAGCIRIGLTAAIKLGTWSLMRIFFEDHTGRMSDYKSAVFAGLTSAAVGMCTTLPLQVLELRMIHLAAKGNRDGFPFGRYWHVIKYLKEEVKQRNEMQTNAPPSSNFIEWQTGTDTTMQVSNNMGGTTNIANEDLLSVLYASFFPALVNHFLLELTTHCVFEVAWWIESRHTTRRVLHKLKVSENLRTILRESICSLVTRLVCLPLMNIQMRIELGMNDGIWDCVREMYSEKGWDAFFCGSRSELCYGILYSVVFHSSIQTIYSILAHLDKESQE
jgi:hypothetical protein